MSSSKARRTRKERPASVTSTSPLLFMSSTRSPNKPATCAGSNGAAMVTTAPASATRCFDFTGLGSSEGEFANTTFSSNVDDLVAAADHLRIQVAAPAILIGHSLGGAAVLAAAA